MIISATADWKLDDHPNWSIFGRERRQPMGRATGEVGCPMTCTKGLGSSRSHAYGDSLGLSPEPGPIQLLCPPRLVCIMAQRVIERHISVLVYAT
jgi:hypothetical protein